MPAITKDPRAELTGVQKAPGFVSMASPPSSNGAPA
jgi:hypothetical protein